MKAREVMQKLRADGWYELKRKGTSHRQFRHPEKKGKVTVSDHGNSDIPEWTLRSIEEQAGIKL